MPLLYGNEGGKMRRIRCLIVVLTMAMPGLALSEEPVYFVDPNLQAAVEEALGIYGPTQIDMLYLTDLRANERGIVDLTGLGSAANLMRLHLHDNQISNISVIGELVSLKYLILNQNSISDISAPANLMNMDALWLSDNQITDVSALSGLKNLATLSLRGNQVSDISALSGLTSLIYLDLLNNPLNTSAYYIYLPLISSFNPKLTSSTLTYHPNPNPLTDDDIIILIAFGEFALKRLETDCSEYNNWCDGSDLNHSGNVDLNDIAEFAEYLHKKGEE